MGKKFLNVLGIFAALVVSLMLVVVLMCTPVVGACGSMLQTSTLKSVLKDVDYSEFLGSGGASGMDPQTMEALMETELVGEMMERYMDSLFDVLDGKSEVIAFDGEDFKELCREHIDELVPIIEGMIDVPVELTREQLEMVTLQVIETNAADLVGGLPSLDELGLDEEILMGVRMLRTGTIIWGVIAVAAVLSVLILLFRFPRFKGFMWLGVIYLLMGGLNLAASFGLEAVITELVKGAIPVADGGVAAVIVGTMARSMMKGAVVLVGLGVVFVIVFVIGRKVLKKKAAPSLVENYAVYEGGVPDMMGDMGPAETAATESGEYKDIM